MKRWFPPAVLTAIFVLFRVPVLMNAGLINSDGAIAGLQARRMLAGEWDSHHWGRDYLTSLDSVMAAPFFALFGSTPFVLLCVTLLGQLTFTWLAYAIVARRIEPWLAVIATLPLAFMTMALNIYLFYDIRQWCVSVVLFAFWIIDRAPESKRPGAVLMLGLVAGFFGFFIDLYGVQFMPGLILFGTLTALDGTWKLRASLPRLGAVLGGVGMGYFLLQLLRGAAHLTTGRAGLKVSLLPKNAGLLFDQCLPWLIGSKVFAMSEFGGIDAAASPGWLVPVQVLGAIVFGAALSSGVALFFVTRIPWRVRVLGAVGAGVAVSSLSGFLLSTTAEDIMGARLLLPVIVFLPLTLAPLAYLAGSTRRFGLLLSPYLLATAIGGWMSYGTMVDGPLPVRTARGAAMDELAVAEFLRARGVRYAAADYWIAYRLSFVFGEQPIVVPEASEDRYLRWRTEFDAEPRVAYLTSSESSSLASEQIEAALTERKWAYEKHTVQGYTVLLVQKP